MLPLPQFPFVAVAEGGEKFRVVIFTGNERCREWADVASAVVDDLIEKG